MSINKNEIEKSFDDFSTDLIKKINLFFKSFNELTKENLDNFLDFLDLLDIWNSEEEKLFLWNLFYKYNLHGKIVESSVLKGIKEILRKEDIKNSINSFNEKNDINYSRDDNINITRLSFNKIHSISIMKSSLDKGYENDNINLELDNNIENLNEFIDSCDIKKLKKIKNIMILLNYNNYNKHKFLIKQSQIKKIVENYPILAIKIEDFLNYLSLISEKILKANSDDNEFNINQDLYNLSLKFIENKINNYNNQSDVNKSYDKDESNDNNISNLNISHIPNKLEQQLKNCIEDISNINDELKVNINILKDLENSKKNCYKNIINNFKNLLSLKNFGSNDENIMRIESINNDSKDDIKIDIENNISYINKKYEEVDIFFKENENAFLIQDKKIQQLNILIDRLIDKKINLENEKNRLISNKKEIEKNTNIQFNRADEEINHLLVEKLALQDKIDKLLEEIEKLKENNNFDKEHLKELGNDIDFKNKELKNKINDITKLKLENKNLKNKYDSLLNELLEINNNTKNKFKNYENQLIISALDNLSKKMNIGNNRNVFINCNVEQILEQFYQLEKKYIKNCINIEDKGKIIFEKDKKIKQLESDLELYREKVLILSQENKSLKNKLYNNKDTNNIMNDKKSINLEDLSEPTTSIKLNENQTNTNNFTIFKKDIQNFSNNNNEEMALQQTKSGNLFAPPCFTNNGENSGDNNIKIDKHSNNIISNKIFINNNGEITDNGDKKKYVNTPSGEINNNNERVKDNEIAKSINNKYRSSNPYIYDKDDIHPYLDKKDDIFNINNKEILNSNMNLNINEELDKDNESLNIDMIEFKNNGDKKNINISLNKNVENYLSSKDMNNILLKNFENKINIPSYDFLHLFTNSQLKEFFNKIGEDYILSDIFSDIIYLLDKYEQLYRNIIFITKKCIYIIEPETYKIKYTFVRSILTKITLCSINCNIIVLHFITGNDLVFLTLRRPELISYFINKEKDNEKKEKNDIKFIYANEFNIKNDGDYYFQKIKSAMNSTTFNFQNAIKLGYLIKINEGYIFNQYHEKLVVLTEFGIFYFNNPTAAPKKLISLIGAKINDLKNKFGEKLFCFEIITMNKYKIVFGSYCKEDYEEWLDHLKSVKKKFENKNVLIG